MSCGMSEGWWCNRKYYPGLYEVLEGVKIETLAFLPRKDKRGGSHISTEKACFWNTDTDKFCCTATMFIKLCTIWWYLKQMALNMDKYAIHLLWDFSIRNLWEYPQKSRRQWQYLETFRKYLPNKWKYFLTSIKMLWACIIHNKTCLGVLFTARF